MTLTMLAKESKGWTTDEGKVVSPHTLHRATCETCGWAGMAWYADPAKAASHFERHACTNGR